MTLPGKLWIGVPQCWRKERDRTFHTQNGVQTLVQMYKDQQKLANWGQLGVRIQL